jgi:hypothetical protein
MVLLKLLLASVLAPLPAHTWHIRQDGISITQTTSSASSTGIVKLSRTSQYPVSDAVSHHFLSYSFDPAFFYELWGNTTHPNLFSFKMLKVCAMELQHLAID